MTHDTRTCGAGRVYSNVPDAYPVSGTKPANEAGWSRQVIGEKRTFVTNDIDASAARKPFDAIALARPRNRRV